MTTLVLDELDTTLSQDFTINLNRRYSIEGIRPYIYMHNAPAGTFTLSVKDGVTTLASQTFDSAEIKSDLSTADNYAHVWKRLVFDNPFQLSLGTYTLELSSAGYTFAESAYIGWIREFENVFNETSGTINTLFDNPFSFQIFENRRVNL